MHLKTTQEIALIQQGARILSDLHSELTQHVAPGITTKQLDQIAESYIRDHGATPSFQGFQGYPATICTSVNHEVIHGIPGQYALQEGDLLSIDCGVYYQGFHSDSAHTHPVGNISKKLLTLLAVTKEALYKGIAEAHTNNRIGVVSQAIQQHVEPYGFYIVREYAGHGIGKRLHEEPSVPNFGDATQGPKICNGMVIAIEPMVMLEKADVVCAADGWTVHTKNNNVAVHFEHTVAIFDDSPHILT